MTVESASFVEELDPNLPTGMDSVSEGDEHLRLIKSCLRASFPFNNLPTGILKFNGPGQPVSVATSADILAALGDTGGGGGGGGSDPPPQSAQTLLDTLKTVDGPGSGLDADTLDGYDASHFAAASHTHPEYALVDHTHSGISAPGTSLVGAVYVHVKMSPLNIPEYNTGYVAPGSSIPFYDARITVELASLVRLSDVYGAGDWKCMQRLIVQSMGGGNGYAHIYVFVKVT